ncbi:uncharacterized protein VTP21DRAFT_1908 [Calcarisporiella thermophila]|uniref:uncharacterized protein n=1 Tax=Calcarisporiella thermophila TaxID=911321 RepID=UPI0037442474
MQTPEEKSHEPSSKKSTQFCAKCNNPLSGQYVRAIGASYHLSCFRCADCDEIVAQKFFPFEGSDGRPQPLCERDYFRRLNLVCEACGGALRGSYITALDKKYHIEHFTCSMCSTVFGPEDSYYEHDGRVYCHLHYSIQFAVRCAGCQTAILKQFVEINRNNVDEHWHPECYMIHKFWNVKLAPPGTPVDTREVLMKLSPEELKKRQRAVEDKVYQIWTVLSAFEESSAACISDMLLHVSNGGYVEGVQMADKFILHVEVLFDAIDDVEVQLIAVNDHGMQHSREAKMLCKKIVNFFSLLSNTQETGVRRLGITQELLSLVTGLAHYLKILIRIALTNALKLEREHESRTAIGRFLTKLMELANRERVRERELVVGNASDLCVECHAQVEDSCIKHGTHRWHAKCFRCSICQRECAAEYEQCVLHPTGLQVVCITCASNANIEGAMPGFERVTQLEQFTFLLRIALKNLYNLLNVAEPELEPYSANSRDTENRNESAQASEQAQRESAAKAGATGDKPYEAIQLGDIKRVKSIHLDRRLSSSARIAKRSTIVQAPLPSRIESVAEVTDSDVVLAGVPTDEDERTLTDEPKSIESPQEEAVRKLEGKHLQPASVETPLGRVDIVEDKNGITELVHEGQKRDALLLGDITNIAASKSVDTSPVSARRQPHESTPPSTIPPTAPASSGRPKIYLSELSALEYFIVRHIAVLSMEQMLKDHFSFDELLDLIETRKMSLWGKFVHSLKAGSRKNIKAKEGTFGVPLDMLVEKNGVESNLGAGPGRIRIPSFIDEAISAMKQMDMSVEGVFRKNGNIRRLKELSDAIDKNPLSVNLADENPVQVAALLKKFLRDLPEPLLTFKLHRLFVTSQKLESEADQKRVLHLICCLLPKVHRDTMEVLFLFLKWVATFSHVDEESGSKMDLQNLATVITPNILYAKGKDPTKDESFLSIEAVYQLLKYQDEFSTVPEELVEILHEQDFVEGSAELTTKDILRRYEVIVGKLKKTLSQDSPTLRNGGGGNTVGGAGGMVTAPGGEGGEGGNRRPSDALSPQLDKSARSREWQQHPPPLRRAAHSHSDRTDYPQSPLLPPHSTVPRPSTQPTSPVTQPVIPQATISPTSLPSALENLPSPTSLPPSNSTTPWPHNDT